MASGRAYQADKKPGIKARKRQGDKVGAQVWQDSWKKLLVPASAVCKSFLLLRQSLPIKKGTAVKKTWPAVRSAPDYSRQKLQVSAGNVSFLLERALHVIT